MWSWRRRWRPCPRPALGPRAAPPVRPARSPRSPELLRVPSGTVKSRLSRARAAHGAVAGRRGTERHMNDFEIASVGTSTRSPRSRRRRTATSCPAVTGRRRRRRVLATGGTAMSRSLLWWSAPELPGPDDHRPDSTDPATSSPAPTEQAGTDVRLEQTGLARGAPARRPRRRAGPDVVLLERPTGPEEQVERTGVPTGGPDQGPGARREPRLRRLLVRRRRLGLPRHVHRARRDCPRQHTVPVERTGDQTFRVDPAGAAGRYRVNLFGRGHEGDVIADFLWTTPADGPIDAAQRGMSP